MPLVPNFSSIFMLMWCNLFGCSDTENSLDSQIPHLLSTEVLVKSLFVISRVATITTSRDSFLIMLCSHHPCLVGTAKRDSIWKVIWLYMHPRPRLHPLFTGQLNGLMIESSFFFFLTYFWAFSALWLEWDAKEMGATRMRPNIVL